MVRSQTTLDWENERQRKGEREGCLIVSVCVCICVCRVSIEHLYWCALRILIGFRIACPRFRVRARDAPVSFKLNLVGQQIRLRIEKYLTIIVGLKMNLTQNLIVELKMYWNVSQSILNVTETKICQKVSQLECL